MKAKEKKKILEETLKQEYLSRLPDEVRDKYKDKSLDDIKEAVELLSIVIPKVKEIEDKLTSLIPQQSQKTASEEEAEKKRLRYLVWDYFETGKEIKPEDREKIKRLGIDRELGKVIP